MTYDGWFALYRGALGHPIFNRRARKAGELSEFEAWVWILENTAYKPKRVRAGAHVVDLGRGQLAAATRYMAEAFGWKETTVRRFLDKLEGDAMIARETGAGISVITVCNYVGLQPDGSPSGAETAQDRRKTGAEAAQNIKREEGKKVRTSPIGEGEAPGLDLGGPPALPVQRPPAKPGRLKSNREFPDGFTLDDELVAFAAGRGIPPARAAGLFERFENHHRAKGSKFKDWRGAWRTWVLNQVEFDRRGGGGPSGGGGGRESPWVGAASDLWAKLQEESGDEPTH